MDGLRACAGRDVSAGVIATLMGAAAEPHPEAGRLPWNLTDEDSSMYASAQPQFPQPSNDGAQLEPLYRKYTDLPPHIRFSLSLADAYGDGGDEFGDADEGYDENYEAFDGG